MRRLTKFQFGLLSVITAVSIAISGCGQATKDGKDTGAGGDGDKVTLTFAHYRVTNEPQDEAFRRKLEQFGKDHPNVTLKEEAIAHDPYRQRMTTLGASGKMPDMFMANGSMLIDFIPKGYVAEWEGILNEDAAWRDGFLDGAFDDFKSGGKIYGVPIQVQSTHMIYYNKEIFDKTGITTFPNTWDGFKDAITKLKTAGYTPIVMGNKPNWPVGSTLFSTLADRVTGTEWFNGLTGGGAKFTDPQFVQALTAVKELVDIGAFNKDINSIDPDQALSVYFNKQAAMMVSGAWTVGAVTSQAPEDIVTNTKLALFPAVTGGKGEAHAVSGGGGWAYSINSKLSGAKRDAAIALIKLVSDDAFAKEQIEINGMPARKVDNYDKSKLSPLAVEYFELVEGVKYTPVYDIRLAPPVVEVIYRGLQELVIGATTPDSLAKKTQNTAQQQ